MKWFSFLRVFFKIKHIDLSVSEIILIFFFTKLVKYMAFVFIVFHVQVLFKFFYKSLFWLFNIQIKYFSIKFDYHWTQEGSLFLVLAFIRKKGRRISWSIEWIETCGSLILYSFFLFRWRLLWVLFVYYSCICPVWQIIKITLFSIPIFRLEKKVYRPIIWMMIVLKTNHMKIFCDFLLLFQSIMSLFSKGHRIDHYFFYYKAIFKLESIKIYHLK